MLELASVLAGPGVGHSPDFTTSHLLPPPHFGEHTGSILEELLKISPSDVKSLTDRALFWQF